MEGTKELKEVLSFVAELGNAVGKSLEDGKVSFVDARHFINAFSSAGAAVDGLDKVLAELKDLDQVEAQQLVDHVKMELDLADDDLERKIESGFELLKKAYEIYDVVRDYLKPKS